MSGIHKFEGTRAREGTPLELDVCRTCRLPFSANPLHLADARETKRELPKIGPAELPVRRIPLGLAILDLQHKLRAAQERLEDEFDLRDGTIKSTHALVEEVRLKLGALRIMLDVVFVAAGDDKGGAWSHELER